MKQTKRHESEKKQNWNKSHNVVRELCNRKIKIEKKECNFPNTLKSKRETKGRIATRAIQRHYLKGNPIKNA